MTAGDTVLNVAHITDGQMSNLLLGSKVHLLEPDKLGNPTKAPSILALDDQ